MRVVGVAHLGLEHKNVEDYGAIYRNVYFIFRRFRPTETNPAGDFQTFAKILSLYTPMLGGNVAKCDILPRGSLTSNYIKIHSNH